VFLGERVGMRGLFAVLVAWHNPTGVTTSVGTNSQGGDFTIPG
jgi:hypothetical protein